MLKLSERNTLSIDGQSTQRWLSWSKAHDWKSCVRLITDRGFESHPLRKKSLSPIGLGDFFCYRVYKTHVEVPAPKRPTPPKQKGNFRGFMDPAASPL